MNAATLPSLTFAGLLLSFGVSAAPPAESTDETDRVTRSAQGFARDHAEDELRSLDAFEQTVTPAGEVITKPRTSTAAKSDAKTAALFGDSYVYEATTDVFYDVDGDGYYHQLRVQFDVDSIFDTSWVYARIFLSADGTTWEQVFETDDFVIHGSDPDDDYEVETELVSGYTAALYDVLIELYDADDGTLVDEYGPNESPELSLVPLEDSVRDGVEPEPIPIDDDHGGGGAVSWITLPALLAAVIAARRRLRPEHGSARRD